jgi:hypothetical protein
MLCYQRTNSFSRSFSLKPPQSGNSLCQNILPAEEPALSKLTILKLIIEEEYHFSPYKKKVQASKKLRQTTDMPYYI